MRRTRRTCSAPTCGSCTGRGEPRRSFWRIATPVASTTLQGSRDGFFSDAALRVCCHGLLPFPWKFCRDPDGRQQLPCGVPGAERSWSLPTGHSTERLRGGAPEAEPSATEYPGGHTTLR